MPYTCYIYAALDIYSRYKVGLILPKVDEACALLVLYHATHNLPFPVNYEQTDNGLEFQKRFHAKCQRSEAEESCRQDIHPDPRQILS